MNDKTGFNIIDKGFQEDLEKERNKVRAKLEEEIKAGKNPKFSQSQTDWMLAKFPYANNDQRDKAVSAEMEKRQRQKEAFDAEVEKRLGMNQAILEQLHFGKEGRQFALEQSEREEKIQAFKQRQQDKREQEKKARNQTTEQSKVKGEALAKEQKENRVSEQDNSKSLNMRSDFNTETEQGKRKTDAQLKIEQFKKRQREAMKSGQDQNQSKDQDADDPKPEKSPHLTDDFNIAHSKQEIEDWLDNKPEVHSNVDSRLIYDSDVESSQGGGQDGRGSDDLTNTSSGTTTKEEKFKEKMRESFNKEGKEQSSDLEPEM
jgi:hypothetical protein